MTTTLPKVNEIESKWVLIDADGQTLGRMAVEIANILRGRHKVTYTPHLITGDFVIVINAEKVKLTGNKEEAKIYQTYSGYRSGQKETTAKKMREKHPEQIVQLAVRGMLPRNRMGRTLLGRMKVYAGTEHPHTAQKPEKMDLSV